MPVRYYRRRWYKNPFKRYYKRRFRYRHWGPRKTFRRRFTTYRKRRWVRKRKRFYIRKKKKFLILKEFQPRNIKKCKIKGSLTLFQSGPNRLQREYSQFMNSFFPQHNQGGGGWSVIKFSLESLYEQRELMRNYWTQSNVQLPLCRYTGCKLKLYRQEYVDYVCSYSLCFPMRVSKFDFVSAAPNNMLMKKHKIIVPSKKNSPHRKNYIIKRIKPPEQFQNKWYFAADLYKTPFFILTTTACDLNRMSLNPKSLSSNIDIHVLNLDIFKNHNFKNTITGTVAWGPKPLYWLYGTENGDQDPTIAQLIPLIQTKTAIPGKPIGNQAWTDYKKNELNFGNIFETHYLTQTKGVFIGNVDPQQLFNTFSNTNNKRQTKISKIKETSEASQWTIAPLTQRLIQTIRYTPDRDKGDNSVWVVKDSDTQNNWDPPDDDTLQNSGFPLWCLLWGFTDWLIKLKSRTQIEDNMILVVHSPYTYPEKQFFVPIDQTFIDGNSPWQEHYLSPSDSQNWHPVLKYQERQIENICETGPYTAKTSTYSIEAHCYYRFYFKWGGCTTDIQNITDPGDLPHYPVPNNFIQGPQIQDPSEDPKNEIWDFDIRRHFITDSAATRIKTDYKPAKITFTGSTLSAEPTTNETLQALNQTPTQEEEEKTPEQQLQLLRDHRHQLRHQLRQLLKQTPSLKYSVL
nr:MAG: ORF1 [TTV-like mini virus]